MKLKPIIPRSSLPSGVVESIPLATHARAMADHVCQACTKKSSPCPTFPEKRVYCTFERGPTGWSHSPGDPFVIEASSLAYNFVGLQDGVFQGRSGRRLRHLNFVLRHELQHERQRWCLKRFERGGISPVDLFGCELEANVQAWDFILVGLPQFARFVLWLPSRLECMILALAATAKLTVGLFFCSAFIVATAFFAARISSWALFPAPAPTWVGVLVFAVLLGSVLVLLFTMWWRGAVGGIARQALGGVE
jgi:hypothetical protein